MRMSSLDLKSVAELINSPIENIHIIDINAITDAFRFLRNLCGTKPSSQDEVLEVLSIENVKSTLFAIATCENANEELTLCLQVGLQFLGNFIVNNVKNQEKIWSTCQDLLEACLTFKNPKVQNCCAMIFYNIFLGHSEFLNELKHPYEDLYALTVNENTSEFAIFILEIFLLKSNYVLKFYEKIKSKSRLIILEIVKTFLSGQNNQIVTPELIKFFSNQFTTKSDLILKTCENYVYSLDPVEVIKILDLLVAFSSNDKQCYFEIVQKETSLLINCIELLKNIHMISKEKGNNFSMITKISDISEVEKSASLQEHPVFGLKCSLIRLIGNFCWKNTANQNIVRELNCIPVLLDCCNIDARNPFIIQWCVLAVRNVCERNSENQQIIANLSKKGVIDSARLQELGITLSVDDKGDALCIAPLK